MNIPQVLNFCPAIFNPDLFELLLTYQSCPMGVSFKWYHWVLNIHILGDGIVVDESGWLAL